MSYALCGLRVVSDLLIPDLLPWTGDDRTPDVEIRLGEVPKRLEAPVHTGVLLQIGEDGTCLYTVADVAAYLVEGGRRITVQPFASPFAVDPSTAELRVFLLGSVFGFLCHQRGLLPLHAGCVEIDGRAVAFAADSGGGKSTLTAAFLRRGYRVLADDVTVVDTEAPGGPLVLPSYPRIKLWRDAIDGLGLSADGLERTRPQMEKFHLPVKAGFRAEPLPLAAICHLRPVPEARLAGIEPQRGIKAVDTLLGVVYRQMAALRMGRRPAVLTALMRVATLPGSQLSWVPNLAALDATIDMLVARHAAAGGERGK